MKFYGDTSFVAALFLEQDLTEAAWKWWRSHESEPLFLSRLTRLEFCAVIHARACNDVLDKSEAEHCLHGLEAALSEGLLIMRNPAADKWFAEAHRLVDHFMEGFSCKSLDVLHVAAAKVTGAETLVTFDAAQRKLALAAGLQVHP
jgi:predicted nucleic acid-binding protein